MTKLLPAVGAVYQNPNQCTFCVWAPLKEKVELVFPGTPEKKFEMTSLADGYWSVTVDDVKPLTRYFFRIDEKTLSDPASRFQPEGVHGPSAVVAQNFSWSDSSWKGIELGDMIMYELHVGTFTPKGTFEGVIEKLSYLKNLGVNAIELMPVAQFPGSRNWGYDGVYPFAAQDSYGGPEGLKKLVDAAHRQGIAVVLDVVYNHQGPEGNYIGEFAPYFTDKYKTFWGSALNFDDAYCDGVRNYYWQNALMWLDEYHIDGLRLDAVHAIWDFSANHFVGELSNQVRGLEQRTGRKKVLIAEFDLNNPRYIDDPLRGGYGLDGQWVDEFHHAFHSLITGEREGYYEDFGEPRHLEKSLRDSYVYTGEYSEHRKKYFGRDPEHNPYSQFVVFTQNHDQVGNRMLGDRLTTSLSFEALKLSAVTLILAPQVPMLFMGEEYRETNPFQYFISHTDKNLVEMVREGRRKEFSHFNWEGEVPDPQSEKTFQQCVLSWDYEQPERRKLLELYQELIRLRKERKALRGRKKDSVRVYPSEGSRIICFERYYEGDTIVVILNFDKSSTPFNIPSSVDNARKILDTASLTWRGPGEMTGDALKGGDQILIPAHSALIFEK